MMVTKDRTIIMDDLDGVYGLPCDRIDAMERILGDEAGDWFVAMADSASYEIGDFWKHSVVTKAYGELFGCTIVPEVYEKPLPQADDLFDAALIQSLRDHFGDRDRDRDRLLQGTMTVERVRWYLVFETTADAVEFKLRCL